jgi:uncharacterized BrkB/YihY/UPF0761 family membrane protein
VYGVFAGAVIGMVATYLAVYVVLLGAVLNTELASPHRSRRTQGPEPGGLANF